MQSDEQEIRQLVSTWMAASKAREVQTVLSLMADDVIFLMPGQEVMDKAGFAAAARAQSGQGAKGMPDLKAKARYRRLKFSGTGAFMWTKLTVVATSRSDAQLITRGLYPIHSHETEGKVVIAARCSLHQPTASRSSRSC